MIYHRKNNSRDSIGSGLGANVDCTVGGAGSVIGGLRVLNKCFLVLDWTVAAASSSSDDESSKPHSTFTSLMNLWCGKFTFDFVTWKHIYIIKTSTRLKTYLLHFLRTRYSRQRSTFGGSFQVKCSKTICSCGGVLWTCSNILWRKYTQELGCDFELSFRPDVVRTIIDHRFVYAIHKRNLRTCLFTKISFNRFP